MTIGVAVNSISLIAFGGRWTEILHLSIRVVFVPDGVVPAVTPDTDLPVELLQVVERSAEPELVVEPSTRHLGNDKGQLFAQKENPRTTRRGFPGRSPSTLFFLPFFFLLFSSRFR